jgi:ribosome-associated protein
VTSDYRWRAIDEADSADVLAAVAARAAEAKATGAVGAGDVLVLDVSQVLAVADWFVVVSAANSLQVKAIVDEVEQRVAEELGIRPRAVEGMDHRRWVVIDYGDVVVHVFHVEDREFYRLERLFPEVDRLRYS